MRNKKNEKFLKIVLRFMYNMMTINTFTFTFILGKNPWKTDRWIFLSQNQSIPKYFFNKKVIPTTMPKDIVSTYPDFRLLLIYNRNISFI